MTFPSTADAVVVYDGAVVAEDLVAWNSELDDLLTRMGPLFYRTESRRHAEQYIKGLLSPLQRKNGWTMAEYVGELEPKALQRFLNLSPWDVDELLALNREYAMETLASPTAILVADPTGFAKKGSKSAGVQRQYSGTLGRVDNCQIATFLGYVTPGRDRVLLDRRLYLPKESWIADRNRCAEAGVPAEVTFKTRPEQVVEMIEEAVAAKVPFAWFTADEEFGQNPGLCDYLQAAGISYVMAVPKNTTFIDTTGKETRLSDLAPKLNHTTWQRRACGIGAKGFRVYDWVLLQSIDPDHQYMIRNQSTTANSPTTGVTTRGAPGSVNSSTLPAPDGPSKNASAPARTRSDSTNTRSESTTPGTGTSPSPCSRRPSSPSPHTNQKGGISTNRATERPPKHIKQPRRIRLATPHSPKPHPADPRRNTPAPESRRCKGRRNRPRAALV